MGEVDQQRRLLTSMETSEHYTPPWIIDLVKEVFGGQIDLDPASYSLPQEWIRAKRYFTAQEDGLEQDWFGNVFVNWPYTKVRFDARKQRNVHSPLSPIWSTFTIKQYEIGNTKQIIALCYSKNGYDWFDNLVKNYTTCFIGRVSFVDCNGQLQRTPAKHASALVYFGEDDSRFREVMKPYGWFNDIRHLEKNVVY